MNAIPGLGHYRSAQIAARRFRDVGDLTLDLAYHDARVEDAWLGLAPREFQILWRLAEQPGEAVREEALKADLWRLRFGLDVGDVAALAADLAARLAAHGLAGLISEHPGGGWMIGAAVPPARAPAMLWTAHGH